ncbi:pilus assembly protein, partial [bacterium]|nr:pilus assembly protein [bacterium]
MKAWSCGERGSATVEFALVLPILMLLLFGIIEFGRVLSVQHLLNTAAREGAR